MAIHDIRQIKGFDGSTYIIKDASAIASVTVSNNNLTGTLRGGSTFSVALPGITLSVHGTGNAIATMSVSNHKIDVSLSSFSTGSHTHGNISNTGTIATSVSIETGDRLIIRDNTNGKIVSTSISFDGATTTSVLSKKGEWVNAITLADASNGSTGLAIAEDVYKELIDVEEVMASSQITMALTLGMNNDFSVTWSTESGIPSTVSYREAIEYVSLNSASTDEKQKVSATTSKFYISGVTGTPNGTAVEGVANTNAFISGGNKLIIPNVSISTATMSTLNGTSVPVNPKFTDTVYTHPAATGDNTTSTTTSTIFTVLDTLSKDSSGHVTSVNTKTVTVPEASTANDITAAVTVGYITKNSTIPEGTTLNDLVDLIFNPTLGVIPKNPTVSISNASTSNSDTKEIGSTVNVKFSRTYNDGYFQAVDSWGANQAAGCATNGNPIYYRGSTTLSSNIDSLQIGSSGITYKVRQYYNKSSNVPVDNKGHQLTDVSIAAGYAEKTYSYTAKYKYFIGYCATNSFNGGTIRSFDTNGWIANTVSIPDEFDVPGNNYMVVAVPTGYKLDYIDSGFAGVEVTSNFTNTPMSSVSLDATNYNVYWNLPVAATTKFLSIRIAKI